MILRKQRRKASARAAELAAGGGRKISAWISLSERIHFFCAGAIAIALSVDAVLAIACILGAARNSEGRELLQLRPYAAV